MVYNKYFALIIYLFFIIGCNYELINKEVKVIRFEKEFYNSSNNELNNVIDKYPYLFPNQFPKSVWITKKNDSLELELFKKSEDVFENFIFNSKKLHLIFDNANEFLNGFKRPHLITLINKGRIEDRIISSDSLLFISLNFYLGSNYYPELPNYISNTMDKKYIFNDIAYKISENYVSLDDDRTLLSVMIYNGKLLYLNKQLNPDESNSIIFKTTKEKLNWAESNEFEIWNYFIENELFFNTDLSLRSRFISKAPYSKFNLDIDKKSPGSIGMWLGYKIVDSYMKSNKTNINKLLNTDHYTIFKESKYKPKSK